MFTAYWIAFAPPQKPYRMGLLYIHKNGDFGAISVTADRSCAAAIFKVARYSFPGPIPPKFEHKLRRHKQSFEKIATTVELDKDENLL